MSLNLTEHALKILVAASSELQPGTSLDQSPWRSRDGLISHVVPDIPSLLREMGRSHFDCVVIEASASSGGVNEAVALVHALNRTMPIVVLGDEPGTTAAVGAVREGAFDYLIRAETDSPAFVASLHRAVRHAQLERHVLAASEASRVAANVLKERELQIRGFFDFAGAAMALLDPAGRVVRANPALRRLTGYELGEISELTVVDLVVENERSAVSLGLAQLLERRLLVWKEEVQLDAKLGDGIWLELTIALICDEDGCAQGYTLHASDITGRKETEAELQRSERRFQKLLAQAPIGIFETNVDGECRYVNQKWSEVTGQSYSQAIGSKWSASVHRDDLTPLAEEWASAVGNSVEFSKEFRFQRTDASVVWVSGHASPMKDNKGRVTGYLGTVADITGRHLAEEHARRTGALLRGVLDNAPYIVVVTSNDGVIWDFNRGAEKHLGYSTREAVGQLATELLHVPEELKEFTDQLAREFQHPVAVGMPALATADGPIHPIWTYVRKDGSRFQVELAVREMRDFEGRLYGYVAIGRDITERLRRSKELVEAKELAEQASSAKADFLARMSHEIRTPMNTVIGMTEIALQTRLSKEQREYLELVQNSGQSLLRIINDILDFSRGEANRLVLEEISFDLRETLCRCLRGLSLMAREKGVELVLRVADDAPRFVVGDSHRIQQILVNLVGNAVKFTEAGEVVVDVACSDGEPSRPATLYMQVSDTGPGVAPEEQEKIFSAFSQQDSGIARRYGGTGLGLAICSQLVELMGGEIWLDSEVGSGSCFHVTLGVSCAERVLDESESESPSWGRNSLVLVLVVEPNDKSRDQTRRFLESWGHTAICVATQAEALREVQALEREHVRFSSAILDLPAWDERGLRFVRELERSNGPCGIVCLSPTNRGESERWVEDLVSLVKPVQARELRQALKDAKELPTDGTEHESLPRPQLRASRALRILVAEDNPTNQLVVSTMLDRLGYQVELVENGQVALERTAVEAFDLVLMDLEMPVMGGMEAVRRLRQREAERGGHLPVIALTAQAMMGDREACLAGGMDGYLSKPLDMSSLHDHIEQTAYAGAIAQGVARLPHIAATATAVSSLGDVDLNALVSRIGDSPSALAKVAELFERDSAHLLGVLSQEIEKGGDPVNSSAAHTLKGMLCNVCASRAAAHASALENSMTAGRWTAAKEELLALSDEVVGVLSLLRASIKASAGESSSETVNV